MSRQNPTYPINRDATAGKVMRTCRGIFICAPESKGYFLYLVKFTSGGGTLTRDIWIRPNSYDCFNMETEINGIAFLVRMGERAYVTYLRLMSRWGWFLLLRRMDAWLYIFWDFLCSGVMPNNIAPLLGPTLLRYDFTFLLIYDIWTFPYSAFFISTWKFDVTRPCFPTHHYHVPFNRVFVFMYICTFRAIPYSEPSISPFVIRPRKSPHFLKIIVSSTSPFYNLGWIHLLNSTHVFP